MSTHAAYNQKSQEDGRGEDVRSIRRGCCELYCGCDSRSGIHPRVKKVVKNRVMTICSACNDDKMSRQVAYTYIPTILEETHLVVGGTSGLMDVVKRQGVP